MVPGQGSIIPDLYPLFHSLRQRALHHTGTNQLEMCSAAEERKEVSIKTHSWVLKAEAFISDEWKTTDSFTETKVFRRIAGETQELGCR
jgi:hypothetical protein